jgi:hypothetical protein
MLCNPEGIHVNDRPTSDRIGSQRRRDSEWTASTARANLDRLAGARIGDPRDDDRLPEAQHEDPERWDGMA